MQKQLNIRSHFRRAMAAVLAGVLAVSLSVNAFAAETSFSDVPASHAFHDAITWCADQGIVGGYTDGTFQPAKTVTRSNFAVMLSRAFYADEVAKYSTEKNLQYGTFYPNYLVMRLYGALNNTSFSTVNDIRTPSVMNKGIARYDMAQLMTNIMNSKGFAASTGDKSAAIGKIADYNEIPSQYKDAVSNVYALGIIGGYSDGTFGGEVTMNRGQAAFVIYRMMQFSGGSSTEAETTTETPSTPAVPDPVEPETPTMPATLTLRDGSTVTEANALKIIEQIKQVYG